MSDCLHCDIHELLESQLQSQTVDIAEIAGKVTEVLADLVLMAPPDEQSTLMADILANLGSFLLEKKQSADPNQSTPFKPLAATSVRGHCGDGTDQARAADDQCWARTNH